jgi:hypothetical protein
MREPAMQYYRRYCEDGSCRVICLNCYEMLGTGLDREAVDRLEAGHVCREWTRAAEGSETRRIHLVDAARGKNRGRGQTRVHRMLLLLAIALLFYAVPTTLELLASVHVNTWLAVILPGDVAGCAALIGLARMPRAGVLLYLVTTGFECILYLTHAMGGVTLAWVADLIPTLVLMSVGLRSGLGIRKQQVQSFS